MDILTEKVEILVLEEITKQFSADDFDGSISDEYLSIINGVVSGNNHSVFEGAVVQGLVGVGSVNGLVDDDMTVDSLEKLLVERLGEFLRCSASDDDKSLRHLIVLLVAIANMKIFLEHNWVGPPVSTSLWPNSNDLSKRLDGLIRPGLLIDGEDVHAASGSLFNLFLAKLVLLKFRDELNVHCKTSKFWLIRCLWMQQFLYSERLPSLKSDILDLVQDVEKSNPLFSSGKTSRTAFIQFHIESCHINYFYYEPSTAHKHMEKIEEASGLAISLIGALGKRTRFQQSTISQLILRVERSTDGVEDELVATEYSKHLVLPKNCSLDDEAVLDKIQLEDPEAWRLPRLCPLEQCYILGLCYHHRRNKEGQGSVVKEETMAYTNCVLAQPQSWCIETMALYTRCKWEYEGTRYIHRSLSQLEELVHQYKRQTKPPINRLQWVFPSVLPPHWVIEHDLGTFLDSMGLTNGALEVFERLQMWEDVIRCHVAIGNKNKAESLIRSQLAIKETPLLWCYLGDITKDGECYEKAWEMSGHRFSRAQRSLGLWYLWKREFEKSLEHFEKSLEINPLQVGLWFSYGCAALSCGQFEKAATGFRRCVNLDNDNFEAWNNLATAYIRGHNKPRAFVTLYEAIKWDYENWRLWENYLIVSVDIGQFEETMRAYHRLLDLRQKHTDVEVLTLLTKAVCENLKDATGQDSVRLRPKLLELFGHITSKVTSNGDIWRLYARVTSGVDEGQTLSESHREKALQYLQKSHRCCTTLTLKWDKDPEKCIDVCQRTACLAEAYKSYLSLVTDEDQKLRIKSSAKLDINGVLVLVEKNKIDFPPSETLDKLEKAVKELKLWLVDILAQR